MILKRLPFLFLTFLVFSASTSGQQDPQTGEKLSWVLPFVLGGTVNAVATAQSQRPEQSQAVMQEHARRAAQKPMKLDVQPVTQGAHLGDKVSVVVTLLDEGNHPATWNRQSQVEVAVTGPSGKAQKYALILGPGQSTAHLSIDTSEVGLLSLKAREINDTLLPGGNSLLVSPKANLKKAAKAKRRTALFSPARDSAHLLRVATRSPESPASPARSHWPAQEPLETSQRSASLMLINSSGKDEILSDGKDFARIQVYYIDPEGSPASSDIKVWLTWTNGVLDPQEPLVIKKGDVVTEAHWSSLSVVNATVSIVNSAPKYSVTGSQKLEVSFVPPIHGIAPRSSNPLKLSLVDCEPVVAQFFDQQGRPVQTSKLRHITFISSNPSLHLDPASADVLPNQSETSVFLIPTWSGVSSLDVWTPGYDHQTIEVRVTIWLVLLLCLSGGVAGGIAAKDALKASVIWRIFVGILGAVVLVWICVYAVLPRTHSVIAHNLISVFVVGIVGGYGGTRVLDFAGKKLGYM